MAGLSEPRPQVEPYSTADRSAFRPRVRGLGLREVMILIILSGILVWFGLLIGPQASIFLGICLGISAVLSSVTLLMRRGSIHRETTLWVMALASEKGLPLVPAIEALADTFSASQRFRLWRFAEFLRQRHDLADALDRSPGVLPRAALVYAKMGWDAPTMGRALHRLASDRSRTLPFEKEAWSRFTLVGITILAIQVIGWFSLYFVVPRIRMIWQDFGAELPWMTTVISRFGSLFSEYPWLNLIWPIEVIALILLPFFWRGVSWFAPTLFDGFFRRWHGTTVLRVLASEVESNRPIGPALERLAAVYPSWPIRATLRSAAAQVELGQPWSEALRSKGFIRKVDGSVIDAATRAGNLPWALRELASTIDRRIRVRTLVVTHFLFIASVMALGVVVAVMALGCFMPLVQIIEALS